MRPPRRCRQRPSRRRAHLAHPSAQALAQAAPRGRTSSVCVPTDSVSSPSSRRSSAVGAGSSDSSGTSASRRRSGSAVGSRSVSELRQSLPDELRRDGELPGSPAGPLRAGEHRPISAASARASVSSPATGSETPASPPARPADGAAQRRRRPPPSEPPCFRAVRTEPIGDRGPGEACQLPQALDAELRKAPPSAPARAGRTSSGSGSRKRCVSPSSMMRARLAGATVAAASAAKRREAAPTRAPLRPHGVERAPECLPEPAGKPLHAPGSEVDAPRLDRLDCEARPSSRRSTASHSSSTPAGSCSTSSRLGHVASASESRIPGRTPARRRRRCTSRGGRAPRRRRERHGPACQLGPAKQRSPESKGRNRETGGPHENVCSTRTHVLLSSSEEIFLSVCPFPLGQTQSRPAPRREAIARPSRRSRSGTSSTAAPK